MVYHLIKLICHNLATSENHGLNSRNFDENIIGFTAFMMSEHIREIPYHMTSDQRPLDMQWHGSMFAFPHIDEMIVKGIGYFNILFAMANGIEKLVNYLS